MIELAKGAQREITDYELSRYACYLIVQNGDPRKKVIALGQTYFAIRPTARKWPTTSIRWMKTAAAWLCAVILNSGTNCLRKQPKIQVLSQQRNLPSSRMPALYGTLRWDDRR